MTNTDRLFAKQLGGEPGPTREAVSRLVREAARLYKAAPWEQGMGDRELIAVDPRDGSDRCYCIFMGTLGEMFGMQAYVGTVSYYLYRQLVEGDEPATPDYIGQLRALSVEFAPARELKPPDKEAIASEWPAKGRKPVFRAWRPRYLPFFVNEDEAARLTDCLEGVLAFLPVLESTSDRAWWGTKGRFPLVRWHDAAWRVEEGAAPVPATSDTDRAEPNAHAVATVQALRKNGVLQATHVFGSARIGKPQERQSLMRVALASEASSGFVYSPVMAPPETKTGQMLNDVVLGAIAQRRAVPTEVQVGSAVHGELLEPLAGVLGFRVRVRKSLPALDDAVEGLMEYLG